MKTRRLSFVVFSFLLLTFSSLGQSGNSWINYGQEYFKIKTAKDDIHRVTFDDLVAAGYTSSTFNPDYLQLFHRGEEVAIFVEDGGDGIFDKTDYIDFYGRRNDGVSDVELFNRPRDQVHQYYNMFSDTTAFFLTINQNASGKRMQRLASAGSGLTPISSHDEELLNVYTNIFSFGQYYPIGNPTGETKLSKYDAGQMFLSNVIIKNENTIRNGTNFRDFAIEGFEVEVQEDGKPLLDVQLVGFNNRLHNARVYVGPNTDNLRLIRDNSRFNYNNSARVETQVEWTDIEEGRMIVRVEAVGFDEIPVDQICVSYIKVNFPQSTDMQSSDEKFLFIPESASAQQITVQNVAGDVSVYDVTDYKNPALVDVTGNGAERTMVLAASSAPRKLFLKRLGEEGGQLRVIRPVLEPVEFKYENVQGKFYIMISHEYLRNCANCDYEDPVQAYIDYRESLEGGEHNVLYADVNDLYNEFNYGEFSPLAIRRFVEHVYNSNSDENKPSNLFLIGKSRRVDNRIQRLPNPLSVSSRDLVPTLGAPGSDILFTEGLSGVAHYPAFPVGRLSVSRSIHVGNYLDKVKEKEQTIKSSPWTKNFVQLSGGLTTNELRTFRELIEGFRDRVSGDFLGANVKNISKQTNNAVQKFNLSEEVNRGVGFITFFGHSSSRFTDIDIGEVTDPANGYENKGRYPVFLVNGCRGGEIFFFSSFGENWLAAKDKGAVNYLAHSDVGISTVLGRYSNEFYELMAQKEWITRSIGEIQQQTIANFLETPALIETVIATAEQTVLQGDPALPVFGHDKVDYVVRPEDIFLRSRDGRDVTATTQFFELGVVVNNGGITTESPLTVRVNRRLADGTEFNLPAVQVDPVAFRDTIYYEISNQGIDAFGDNTFEVILDPDNLVDEGSETNNTAFEIFNFPATGTFNTGPIDFAMLNETNVTLVAQAANLQQNDKVFIVELDTTNSFDSPWVQRSSLTGKGIVSWDVELLPETFSDTVRYYWRSVFEEDENVDPPLWNNSTFTFVRNGEKGWGQTTYDQFEDLSLSSVRKDQAQGNWIFAGTETDIEVVTYGANHLTEGGRASSVVVDINRDPQIPLRPCNLSTLNMVAFNRDSGQPYFVLGNIDLFDDPLRCGKTPSVINTFSQEHLSDINISQTESLINQYVNGVDEQDSVLIFSVGSLDYTRWNSHVIEDLGRLGIAPAIIQNLQEGEPFIGFGAKGSLPGTARTVIGVAPGNLPDASQETISLNAQLVASTDSGTVTTPGIGPASRWGRLTQRISTDLGEDQVTFEVRGVAQDGTSTVLFPDVRMEELDLSSIDPTVYPFIRLYVNMEDRVSATPPQLQEWTVSFQGVPEGVISLQNDGNRNIELQEAEPFLAQFKFTNISEYDFPSPLPVRYTITNQITGQREEQTAEIPAVAAGQEVSFELPVETEGRIGLNDMEVFVNPGGVVLEQLVTNNIIRLKSFFNVIRDEINPNIDVTFDGVYILDGDIVSPTPLINVELRDNNPFLLKTDATGVDIKLGKICDGCEMESIDITGSDVEIIPATEGSNFRVEFSPDFMQESLGDGMYRLEVEVPDASGNQSGIGPYSITFEIVTISSITHFYPYPNPFSTSTRFVFTLTGDEIPDQIKIQIFTVTGKIVREITQEEIGPIRIGQNITQYAWDGRDEFGDQLANGTYLYRVQVRSSSGKDIVRRGTSADKAFDNNFGKLVILR